VKYSKVQMELWRIREQLDRKLSAMSGKQVRDYFAEEAKQFEARTGIRLRAAEGPCIMHGKGRAMRTLKLYIETSVWSHWYADDAPERQEATMEFFRACGTRRDKVVTYISGFVLDELQQAPEDLAADLVSLVDEQGAILLRPTTDVLDLADAYAVHGALPRARRADRLHAAMATVAEMDMLVSWNYRHLVNVSRRERINSVNRLVGYAKRLEIVSPPEVFEDEVQQETD